MTAYTTATVPGLSQTDPLNIIASYAPIQPPSGMRIMFINGILNTGWTAQDSRIAISRSVESVQIEPFFNDEWKIEDTINKLVLKLLDIKTECEEEMLRIGVDERVNHICIVIIAHSHGTVILHNALKDVRLSELKRRIQIIAIGGAILFERGVTWTVKNIINDLDVVPLLCHLEFDSSIVEGWRPSFIKSVARFFLDIIGPAKEQFQELLSIDYSYDRTGLAGKVFAEGAISISEAISGEELEEIRKVLTSLRVQIKMAVDRSLSNLSPTVSMIETFHAVLGGLASVAQAINYDIKSVQTPLDYRDIIKLGPHTVPSYIPAIAEILRDYINNHQALLSEFNLLSRDDTIGIEFDTIA